MAKPVGSVNFSDAETETLRELATVGITMAEASRRLQRSSDTVRRHASKLGLTWHRPSRAVAAPAERAPNPFAWTDADDRWLLALAAAGWTQGLAANEMDRPHTTVIRHSKKLRIRWPPRNRSRKGAPVERPT